MRASYILLLVQIFVTYPYSSHWSMCGIDNTIILNFGSLALVEMTHLCHRFNSTI